MLIELMLMLIPEDMLMEVVVELCAKARATRSERR